jgi:PAS domain S-box-containing protein
MIARSKEAMVRERKLQQPRLESSPRHQGADHHSTDLLVVLDGTGSIREISPSVTHLLAHRRGQLLGTSFLEILHPDDVASVESLLAGVTRPEEELAQVHLRLRRVDGGWRSFEAVARVVSGSNRQPLLVVEAYDVSAVRLSQTAERPAMQLGGPLAESTDQPSQVEDDSCDEIPGTDLIERAGARDETVLVALDDPDVSRSACNIMRHLGYAVLEATSPADAEGFARVHKGAIHLLVADLATPRVRGREFVRSMQTILPGLKSLFISCQRYGSLAERRVFESGARLLHEPFTPEELAHAVRRAIEGATER